MASLRPRYALPMKMLLFLISPFLSSNASTGCRDFPVNALFQVIRYEGPEMNVLAALSNDSFSLESRGLKNFQLIARFSNISTQKVRESSITLEDLQKKDSWDASPAENEILSSIAVLSKTDRTELKVFEDPESIRKLRVQNVLEPKELAAVLQNFHGIIMDSDATKFGRITHKAECGEDAGITTSQMIQVPVGMSRSDAESIALLAGIELSEYIDCGAEKSTFVARCLVLKTNHPLAKKLGIIAKEFKKGSICANGKTRCAVEEKIGYKTGLTFRPQSKIMRDDARREFQFHEINYACSARSTFSPAIRQAILSKEDSLRTEFQAEELNRKAEEKVREKNFAKTRDEKKEEESLDSVFVEWRKKADGFQRLRKRDATSFEMWKKLIDFKSIVLPEAWPASRVDQAKRLFKRESEERLYSDEALIVDARSDQWEFLTALLAYKGDGNIKSALDCSFFHLGHDAYQIELGKGLVASKSFRSLYLARAALISNYETPARPRHSSLNDFNPPPLPLIIALDSMAQTPERNQLLDWIFNQTTAHRSQTPFLEWLKPKLGENPLNRSEFWPIFSGKISETKIGISGKVLVWNRACQETGGHEQITGKLADRRDQFRRSVQVFGDALCRKSGMPAFFNRERNLWKHFVEITPANGADQRSPWLFTQNPKATSNCSHFVPVNLKVECRTTKPKPSEPEIAKVIRREMPPEDTRLKIYFEQLKELDQNATQ